MALDPGSGRRSVSPESSGRDSPAPRQWRNQLSAKEAPVKDKHYRKYALGVDRALSLFDTALQEWADYISFLNRLLKALQARPAGVATIPSKSTVAKRLSQCLNPSLPSGVHQKALEVYGYVFSIIGRDGLSSDLPLYLPGLASTLSFASLSVRGPFLDLIERSMVQLDRRSLRLAMKALILTLLPGLEEETSEEFERTLRLMEGFRVAVRPEGSEDLTPHNSTGDDFFWQCFFLATITSQSRRAGALAYLARGIPRLGPPGGAQNGSEKALAERLAALVTTPEPGLLVRCFAAGLGDEQLLIQRGYLDLLVTHLPLHSSVLQTRAKPADLELLLKAAAGVVIRRDMSLNRRLWTWLLGPEPVAADADGGSETPVEAAERPGASLASKTSYFEEYGLHPLTQALLAMISAAPTGSSPSDRARPYRICLSLMDRWEIGGLVVPEVFLPIVDSVRKFKSEATSKADFHEVLRSASVFFDGVESGLIYGELLGLMAKAIGPGDMSAEEREDKLALSKFIIVHFNVREEEMITVHAPLTALAILCMLQDAEERKWSANMPSAATHRLASLALNIVGDLLDLVPERAFWSSGKKPPAATEPAALAAIPNMELLKKIRAFYVADQGSLEASRPPVNAHSTASLLLQKAGNLICRSGPGNDDGADGIGVDMTVKTRILVLTLSKVPQDCHLDIERLVAVIQERFTHPSAVSFTSFTSFVQLASLSYITERMSAADLSSLVPLLVRRAWSFLGASDPKYHVETVRSLWQLQTALSYDNLDIEAALSAIVVEHNVNGTYAACTADPGRTFAVLWTHTLQDNPSGSDRKPRTPNGDTRGLPRLYGADSYALMLTRPLSLMVDALADERTQLFMAVKTWLNSLIGFDKIFVIFIARLLQLPYIATDRDSRDNRSSYADEDDVDTGSYYLRCISSILRWSPDSAWTVLAGKTMPRNELAGLVSSMEEGDELSIQECLVHICLRTISYDGFSSKGQLQGRLAQLHRSGLTLLHQLLLNPYAERLSGMQLETRLIDRLERSLGWPDPYLQVLLLDVVYASLKIREMPALELPTLPTSPTSEKRALNLDPTRTLRGSVGSERQVPSPPASLLRCLQAGLSSSSSHVVLDAWIAFLTESLPLYSDSVFQVLIPLVETLCTEIGITFAALQKRFAGSGNEPTGEGSGSGPESTLISLLNGLEQVLAKGHDRLLAEEARTQTVKGPDQPQGFFGNMVSGVFASDAPQARSATANDRLTVILAFQDAVRICFRIWSWGQGGDMAAQDATSLASFSYTSLRMRNRARRLLEHLFAAEALECLETVMGIWKSSLSDVDVSKPAEVLNLLPALDGSRPKHTFPAIFDAIYSRTSPSTLDPARKSSLTISLQDTDIVIFLVDYARSLEDDAMDEIWQDCTVFLKDILSNPFPYRQALPSLLDFAAVLGEKVDNTNFGEQRKMRRDLGDLFLRLLTALFTTRPMNFEASTLTGQSEKRTSLMAKQPSSVQVREPSERADDIVGVLAGIVPNLQKILMESDRVLTAATTVSASVVGPTLRSKAYPDNMTPSMLRLLYELSRLPNNQKAWRKDIADAFNDAKFFGSDLPLVQTSWLPLLRQWAATDKDRLPEILGRITAPTTAGIVFGVGATSARLEADRRTQLNLRRIATLVLASADDAFVTDLPGITERLVELLAATTTSSPSSTTRSELYMVLRALVLKTSTIHLAGLWPIINAELHAAISSVVAPDHSTESDMFTNHAILQACKLLDLLLCVAPDDFQLHEWLFVTDTIDAVYRPAAFQPIALADELSEELGADLVVAGGGGGGGGLGAATQNPELPAVAASASRRGLLLGPHGINDEVSMERRDELVAKILRPFFGQLSIFAFESTYAMASVDWEGCTQGLLKDLFDERNIVKAL